ncbi:SPOR domain-containing protein [candidate division KSB1 bacterium]
MRNRYRPRPSPPASFTTLMPGKRASVLPIALILGVYCLLTAACAGRGSGGSSPPEDDWTFKVEGSLNQDEMAAESVPAESTGTPAETVTDPETTIFETIPVEIDRPDTITTAEPEPIKATIPGFRVQVFSSGAADRAELVADEARYLLKEKTYIKTADNLFRVQVGDCLTRQEAEELRGECRLAGYKDSFIVTAQIEVTRSP